MNKLLDDYLCKKYPKIFSERNKSMKETCMCWGFECDEGWFTLIDNLCQAIQFRIDNPGYNQDGEIEIQQVVALQVKEKYGTLRFYFAGGNDEIRGMVSIAEYLSGSICEVCGKMDETIGKTKGWIKTICFECSDKNRPWQPNIDKELCEIFTLIKIRNNKACAV